MTKTLEQLREFHEAMAVYAPPNGFSMPPQAGGARVVQSQMVASLNQMAKVLQESCARFDQDVLLLRFRLIVEELAEAAEALLDGDPSEILWELTDLRYVVEGLVVTLGLDPIADEAFDRIHAANMSKLGDDGNPVRDASGKIIKGPNYRKADLSDLIE